MPGAQMWPDCDEDIRRFVGNVVKRLKSELQNRLTGVYLHGSLAMGSYYRPKSDIDLIAVVDGRLSADLAEKTAISVAEEASRRPTVGNVEMSAITKETAKRVPVPMPFEWHYSSSWHDRIVNREVDYREERTDPDLPSHLMYVTKRGIRLYGRPIPETFGQVEWRFLWDAVRDDLDWILQDGHIAETPFYSVLNICRVFQLTASDSRTVYSKEEGGLWGLVHLPREHHPVIRQALEVYRSSETVTEEQRRTGGREWDRDKLFAFRDYARSRLGGPGTEQSR
ncbi:aminoglycoside adenylyltransferase domain-containing protein [Paenibacillus flagellatus]|nr:aminoglycoside adenylyltransferase domain-containing protein [Paenibacillus flagellatus]